jgi:hypothetical protein
MCYPNQYKLLPSSVTDMFSCYCFLAALPFFTLPFGHVFQLRRNDNMRMRTDVKTTCFDHLIGLHKNGSLRSSSKTFQRMRYCLQVCPGIFCIADELSLCNWTCPIGLTSTNAQSPVETTNIHRRTNADF